MLPAPFEIRDLDPRDWAIIGNQHRFGGMHSRQIARQYRNLRLARDRLDILRASGILKKRDRQLEGVVVYELADRRYFRRFFGFHGHTIRDSQLGHDIAVVDLVDYLEARHPAAVTYAEIQVSRALDYVKWKAPAQPYAAPKPHTPDALLVEGKTVTAIELEH